MDAIVVPEKDEMLDKGIERELAKIEVIGDLSEYVQQYLALLEPIPPDNDAVIITVDGEQPLSNSKYLEISEEAHKCPSPPLVFLKTNCITHEQVALLMYLRGRGIKCSYNLDEIVNWVRSGANAD